MELLKYSAENVTQTIKLVRDSVAESVSNTTLDLQTLLNNTKECTINSIANQIGSCCVLPGTYGIFKNEVCHNISLAIVSYIRKPNDLEYY